MDTNVLYYGNNLEILRKYIPDNSVDLIYLDPPFNSKATYNVLFREPTGEPSKAQLAAFEDTWHWGLESQRAFQELMDLETTPARIKELMAVLPSFVGEKTDMRAYLVMMSIRLLELKRVLRDTGSIYLHCDPTASHYLKIVMDAIFGGANFQNEIVWKRSQTRSSISRIYRRAHDVLLFYSKSPDYFYELQYKDLSEASLEIYSKKDEKGIYRLVPLLVSGRRKGETGSVWRGIDPNLRGKAGSHWITLPSNLEEYEKQGRIVWPVKKGGLPQLKYYLEENKGVPVSDFWDDVDIIPSQSKEALGYPTQKPESLLERIISASSKKGEIVLDPFCGCGTALVAAHRLKRKWIGIDITHLAISIMKWRLTNIFPNIELSIIGEPKDLASAVKLFNDDKYQFQYWAVSLVDGQPYGDKKKGADTGIDGYLWFMDEKDKYKKAIISVKGGKNIHVNMIQELCHVVDREKAVMGIFMTLENPTKPMEVEAIQKGFYTSPLGTTHQKIQIITIEDLLNGKKLDMPPKIPSLQTPPKTKTKEGKVIRMEIG